MDAAPSASPAIGPRIIGALARAIVGLFYRVERVGPGVPGGPALLVANHPNALLDPAIVQSTAGRRVRFLAKSTLFRGPLAILIRSAGSIPVYRRSDAGEDPARNAEMFAAVAGALARGEAICVFPEGTTHSRGLLDPLRTGAARLALSSTAGGVDLTIVPTGINFDHKAVFRSRVTVCFGHSFSCADLLEPYRLDPQEAVRALTARIGERLRLVMVEADPRLDAETVDRIDALYSATRGAPIAGMDRLLRRQAIASGMRRLLERDPRRHANLQKRLRTYETALARFGLTDDFDGAIPAPAAARFAVREALLAILLVPLALAGCLVFGIPYLVTDWLGRRPAHLEMRATFKVLGGALVYGGWIAALGFLAASAVGTPAALVIAGLLPVIGLLSLTALERELDVLESVRTYLVIKTTPASSRGRLAVRRAELVTLLEQTHTWLNESGSAAAPRNGMKA